MTDPNHLRWCPHCRQATINAPLPQVGEDRARLQPLSAQDETQAFCRKLYCVRCRAIWEAAELPAEVVQQLVEAREALEDARRQIAMLRLLGAQQRQTQEPSPRVALRLAG